MINIELNFAQSIDNAQFVNTYIKGFRLEMRKKEGILEFKHPDLTNIEKYNPRLVMMRYRRKTQAKKYSEKYGYYRITKKGWTVDTKFQNWLAVATDEDFSNYDTTTNNMFRSGYQTIWRDYKSAGATLNLKKINEYYSIEPFSDTQSFVKAILTIYTDENRKFVGMSNNCSSAMFGFAIRIDNPYRTSDERSVPYIFSSIYKIRVHRAYYAGKAGFNLIG